MARVQLQMPESYLFTCRIPVRITDLNYGGHVGNDTMLTIIHEARVQFLKSLGYNELSFAGVGLIMSDAALEFKNELFYGDALKVMVTPLNISKIGFDLYYRLAIETDGTDKIVCYAKTAMICFNYETRKIAPIPEEAKIQLLSAVD